MRSDVVPSVDLHFFTHQARHLELLSQNVVLDAVSVALANGVSSVGLHQSSGKWVNISCALVHSLNLV